MNDGLSRRNPEIPLSDDNASNTCPKCGGESICGGLGVMRFDVPIEDARFGKLFRCPNYPLEQDEERKAKLRRMSNLDAYRDKTFDNFLTDRPGLVYAERQSLELAFQIAVNFATDPRGWLLLEGNYGSGKTHLAAAVGNIRLSRGDMVLFITTPDLLDHLRNTYSPSADIDYDEMFDRIRNAPLLILDDLGAENPSSWALEKLFQLLNYRYSHRLATVITTNTNLDMLDPRIRSRLLDEGLIHRAKIVAPDYRTDVQNQYEQITNLALYHSMTFDSFVIHSKFTPGERKKVETALVKAQKYAHRPHGWLFITGEYGCGKTHLAAAIAHHQQEAGMNVTFVTVPDLLDHLRVTFNPSSPVSFDRRFQLVRNAPLLVLDDLGTESASPWAREKLFQILDYRYVAHLLTVITSVQAIEQLDKRIATRLVDVRLCQVVDLFQVPGYSRVISRK